MKPDRRPCQDVKSKTRKKRRKRKGVCRVQKLLLYAEEGSFEVKKMEKKRERGKNGAQVGGPM